MLIEGMNLDFEWDAVKAATNQSKHGVTFEQASSVWQDGLALTVFDAEHSEFEERWFTLGVNSAGVMMVVSHTFTATGPLHARVRLISARPATRNERKYYQDEPR
jgi:uncharacterized protein